MYNFRHGTCDFNQLECVLLYKLHIPGGAAAVAAAHAYNSLTNMNI